MQLGYWWRQNFSNKKIGSWLICKKIEKKSPASFSEASTGVIHLLYYSLFSLYPKTLSIFGGSPSLLSIFVSTLSLYYYLWKSDHLRHKESETKKKKKMRINEENDGVSASRDHLVFAYYVTGHGFGHATRVVEVQILYPKFSDQFGHGFIKSIWCLITLFFVFIVEMLRNFRVYIFEEYIDEILG